MSIFSKVAKFFASSPNYDGPSGVSDPRQWLIGMFGNVMTESGFSVSADDAMRLPGISACIACLSDDLSKVPLYLFKGQRNKSKDHATDHPLYHLLNRNPAPWLPTLQWRRSLFYTAMKFGNSFSMVKRIDGTVSRILPIGPGRVQPRWTEEGEPFYDVNMRNTFYRDLAYSDIVHVPYRPAMYSSTDNGIWGVSPIDVHRESLALGIAAEKFAASFFARGARPSLAIEMDGKLPNDDVGKRIRAGFERAWSGLSNAYRVAILELGMKLKPIQLNNVESQLMEVRKESAVEQCRMYGVPPHKVGILDKATFSNIEHQAIEYVIGPVSSLARTLEEALETALLTDKERLQYFIAHDLDELLKGDIQARYRAYALGRQWGWLSADEIREWENMNPLPGNAGKTFLTPLNMNIINEDGSIDDRNENEDQQPAQEPPVKSSLVNFDGTPIYKMGGKWLTSFGR